MNCWRDFHGKSLRIGTDGKQSRAACDVENEIFKLQMYVIDPVSWTFLLTQNDNAVVSKHESTPKLN